MKWFVIALVCWWLSFQTVAITFGALERFIILNRYSSASLILTGLAVIAIGLGFFSLVMALIKRVVDYSRYATYIIILAILFGIGLLALSGQWSMVLHLYIAVDQFTRSRWNTTIAGLDFGNSVLLLAVILYWLGVAVLSAWLYWRRHKV